MNNLFWTSQASVLKRATARVAVLQRCLRFCLVSGLIGYWFLELTFVNHCCLAQETKFDKVVVVNRAGDQGGIWGP